MASDRCLVTGVAGFVGSHLAERLVGEGHEVIGVDSFTDHYSRPIKERNLRTLRQVANFMFVEGDLVELDLEALLHGGSIPDRHTLGGVQRVFHLAAQPGVGASWGDRFEVYIRNNVLATQRLLEAAKEAPLEMFVYGSSSSVYGDAETFPTSEETTPRPISPYGVTKLAGEHLCRLYWRNHRVPAVSLRYFTVFGPRQRPDMAFHRFIGAILEGRNISIYGDGEQTRDFTYVDDAVEATWRAAFTEAAGRTFNIGGGNRATVNQVIELLEEITGKRSSVVHKDPVWGDVRHTSADTTAAREALEFEPKISLEKGLAAQVKWQVDQVQ